MPINQLMPFTSQMVPTYPVQTTPFLTQTTSVPGSSTVVRQPGPPFIDLTSTLIPNNGTVSQPHVLRNEILTPPFSGTGDLVGQQLQELRDMISKIPGAPRPLEKAAPTSYADSPFTDNIASAEMPKRFSVPSMRLYDGTTDPHDHVAHYKLKMTASTIDKASRESCMCKTFGSTLTGPALQWFVNLPNGSISSFADLVDAFNLHFASSRKIEKQTSDLYRIVQRYDESTCDYLSRFNREKVSITRCDIPTAIEAFRQGLLPDSELYRELTKYPCQTMEDVQAKALATIRLEQDAEAKRTTSSIDRNSRKITTDKKRDDRSRPYCRPSDNRVSAVRNWKEDPKLPPKVCDYKFTTDLAGLLKFLRGLGNKVKWGRKIESTSSKREPQKWCEYHDGPGHHTDECISLRQEIKHLHDSGLLNDILPQAREVSAFDQLQPSSPPTPILEVGCISGGSEICGLTYSAAKRHVKEWSTDQKPIMTSKSQNKSNVPSVTFDETDAPDVNTIHHDALVISLTIGNCKVKRILVDNGSSVNLIMMDSLRTMGLKEADILKKSTPLIGFSGETAHSVGEISLPTYAEGVNKQVKYLVLDCLSSYNVILGRPWIHDMKAIPSTYHQCIKFPTPWGIQEIRGDQKVSKECYKIALKPSSSA